MSKEEENASHLDRILERGWEEVAVSDMELRRWRETATIGGHPFYELLMADGRVPKNAKPVVSYYDAPLDATIYGYGLEGDIEL